MSSSQKLAVIGKPSSVMIYRGIGCTTFPVTSADEVIDLFNEIIFSKDPEHKIPYAIIFLEEEFFAKIPQKMTDALSKRPLPAVVPIPSGKTSDKSYALKRLSQIVERAVGSDILE